MMLVKWLENDWQCALLINGGALRALAASLAGHWDQSLQSATLPIIHTQQMVDILISASSVSHICALHEKQFGDQQMSAASTQSLKSGCDPTCDESKEC